MLRNQTPLTSPVSIGQVVSDGGLIFGPRVAAMLREPFRADELQKRVLAADKKDSKNRDTGQMCRMGEISHWIEPRAIMDRMDMVLGPENWSVEFSDPVFHDVRFQETFETVCYIRAEIMVQLHDGRVLRRDGDADESLRRGKSLNDDAVISGTSNALKRAAMALGIGRYLWQLKDYWTKEEIVQFGTTEWSPWYPKERKVILLDKYPDLRPAPGLKLVAREIGVLSEACGKDSKFLLERLFGLDRKQIEDMSADDQFALAATIARIADGAILEKSASIESILNALDPKSEAA